MIVAIIVEILDTRKHRCSYNIDRDIFSFETTIVGEEDRVELLIVGRGGISCC